VLRLVLRQGLTLALIGIAIGLAGAAWLTQYVSAMLFRVAPLDPAIFAAATLTLVAVALVACYVPARRATRTDLLVALRSS
jgi:putative ABC transport system permease protein